MAHAARSATLSPFFMLPLPDLLPILPFTRPARGEVTLPGSKSLTNRALLLAALCDQPVTLTGALFSEDTHLMAEALKNLGFTVAADEAAHTIRVSDQANGFPASTAPIDLFVGLAGTAARFLTALCAAAPRGVYRIDGIPQMRKRPMKPLIDALRTLGADIRCTGVEGFFPLEIHARGLRGGEVQIDARESSQMLSALLMVAPLAETDVTVTLAAPVRDAFVLMTVHLIHEFNVAVECQHGKFICERHRYQLPDRTPTHTGSKYRIEPDATAASYFFALPLATRGGLEIRGIDIESVQGDIHFVMVLKKVGLVCEIDLPGWIIVEHSSSPCHGVSEDFNKFSDTFLTLAALAPLLDGPTHISGIAHSRKQETDRVAGMARELTKLGQHVVEEHDALTITPDLAELRRRTAAAPIEIETYGDHRFAMSFGILGCHDLHGDGRPWLAIRNPACCAKTFPHFFELLESLRKNSLAP